MKDIIKRLFVFLWLFYFSFANAQSEKERLAQKSFVNGKLENGIEYSIKDTNDKDGKIYMRFFVKAGSLQQDHRQAEVAHLIEHLAFMPSKHFPKGIIAPETLAELNMTLGKDINANTSFRSTRYVFDPPNGNIETIKKGLLWFKDLATNIPLTIKNINAEKKSILQEIIYRKNDDVIFDEATQEMESFIYPCFTYYLDVPKQIRQLPKEDLLRFYKDWYRPDLMHIGIVGNIKNIDDIEKEIKLILEKIPKKPKPRIKKDCDSIYYTRKPQFITQKIKVKENYRGKTKWINYNLYFKQKELSEKIKTSIGYLDYHIWELFLKILDTRIQEVTKEQAMVKNEYRSSAKPMSYSIKLESNIEESETLLKEIINVLKQIKKYGVHKEEYQKAQETFLSFQSLTDDRYWLEQIENHITSNHPIIGEPKKISDIIKQLTLAEFNHKIQKLAQFEPDDIGVIVAENIDPTFYRKSLVKNWLQKSANEVLSNYKLPDQTKSLLNKKEQDSLTPKAYKFLKPRIENTEELLLENGVRVVLKNFKPTPGVEEKEIKLHGFSKSGAACYPKDDYYSALTTPLYLFENGIANFTKRQLASFKEHHAISYCKPYLDYRESGIYGAAKLKNLEALLQLTYLYFKPLKYNEKDYGKWRHKQIKKYGNKNDIKQEFDNAIRKFHGDSSTPPILGYRHIKTIEYSEYLQKSSGQRSVQIYNEVFSQPKNLTFIISGDFKQKDVLPLIRKYLGNIASRNPSKQLLKCKISHNQNNNINKKPRYKEVITSTPMDNVKYNLHYFKAGAQDEFWKNEVLLKVLAVITKSKLQRLRFNLGLGVYDTFATGKYNFDENRSELHIKISALPDELKIIQANSKEIIKELIAGEITESKLQEAKRQVRARYSYNFINRHRITQKNLYEYLRYDIPWTPSKEKIDFLNKLTKEDVVEAVHKFLNPSNRYELVLGNAINL